MKMVSELLCFFGGEEEGQERGRRALFLSLSEQWRVGDVPVREVFVSGVAGGGNGGLVSVGARERRELLRGRPLLSLPLSLLLLLLSTLSLPRPLSLTHTNTRSRRLIT
jgi:hypothetical protein